MVDALTHVRRVRGASCYKLTPMLNLAVSSEAQSCWVQESIIIQHQNTHGNVLINHSEMKAQLMINFGGEGKVSSSAYTEVSEDRGEAGV